MLDLRREGRPFAVATVVRTLGSTPQVVGARLVLDEGGRAGGTLGGGCVEADAIDAAREVLASGGRSLRAYELTEDLAWNTGLVCGGTMWILAERGSDAFVVDGRDWLEDAAHASEGQGPPIAVATLIRRENRTFVFDGRLVVDAEGRASGELADPDWTARAVHATHAQVPHGTARVVPIEGAGELFIDSIASRPRLVVAGGGHVAKAIARQARLLDFDVTVLEDRPEFADASRFDGATVLAGDVPETLASLDYSWNTFLVIATRGHKLDADCVVAAVRTPVRYVGLLGSRRKTVLVEEMLRREGVSDDRVRVLHAPVGLDLGGRTPAEIALSVLAEITQLRYQGTGRPLSQRGIAGAAEVSR
jgi:xanthine dehydrogenase accessory factor